MKRFLFLFTSFLMFYGCEKDFTGTIEPVFYDYQVTSITSFDRLSFSRQDSVRIINIIFNKSANIKNVAYTLVSPSGTKVNTSPVYFTKVSETLYSTPFVMSVNYPPGRYSISYNVTDVGDNTSEAAVHYFNYENIYYINAAPVIRSVSIDPDTVVVNDTTLIQIKAEVFDENSLKDIDFVYFVVFRPNGTTSGTQIQLNDDGVINDSRWDEVANDGIFSRIIQVNQTNDKGLYRFEFRARDRGQKLSEIVSYNVLIQ